MRIPSGTILAVAVAALTQPICAAEEMVGCALAAPVRAGEGWVVRAYGDNAFVARGGLWTNRGDRVVFNADRLPRPAKPTGMSFLARTGFETAAPGRHVFRIDVAERDRLGHFLVVDGRNLIDFPDGIELPAGRHVLAVYLRGAPQGTRGAPVADFAVEMDGRPLGGLAFDAADESAEAVVYDRVFEMKDGLRVWSPAWRTFSFDVPADGLYELAVRYRQFAVYTRVWLDGEQVYYAQGRPGVDAAASFRGELDRSERTDRQRVNFFGEGRAVRFLGKGRHTVDLYANWGPWVWNDDMERSCPENAVFGLRRLTGRNPESDAGFWIEGTDETVFGAGDRVTLVARSASAERREYVLEAWPADGRTACPERLRTPFALEGGEAARLALPTAYEGEWRYAVKNARGETVEGPWEYAVVGRAAGADGERARREPEVVDRVDCTEGAGGIHDFRERGASTVVETRDGAYRRTGPAGLATVNYKFIRRAPGGEGVGLRPAGPDEKPDRTYTTHDWFAYTLKVRNPGRAHILRCQVPNDEYRITTVVAYDRKTRSYNGFGMVSGDAPASGPFSDLDIFLWPNSGEVDVMVINSEGNHGSKLNRAGAVKSMELIEYPDGLPPLEPPAHGWSRTRDFGLRGEQVNLGFNERTWPDFIGAKPVTNGFPNAYTWRPFLHAWDRFGQIAAWRGDSVCTFPVFTYMMVQFQAPEMKLLPTGGDVYTTPRRGGQENVDRTDRDLFLVMLREASKHGVGLMADFMVQRVTAETVGCWANRYGTHTNGMMLSSHADGKPYRSFSNATFPNPAHPAVRKAYVEFCEGMGRRYGRYPAFAGISHRFWPSWPASCESWFLNGDLGYDDFTVGEFSKATGIRLDPVGADAAKFGARREELKTRWRREWFDWRARVCLTLREEMLAALRRHAPNAQFRIDKPHGFYREKAPGSGLDGEVFAGRRDLGMIDSCATIGLGGDAFGCEINHLDPVCFAAFDRRPPAERNPPLGEWKVARNDAGAFPQGACCDGSSRPYPYSLEPAALALADNRLDRLTTSGCWTLPAADARLREFVRAYRAIPDGVAWTRYDLPGGAEAPVSLWHGELDGLLVFWVVNRTDVARRAEVAFDAAAELEDYVTGGPAGAVEVPPFGVRVFAAKGAKRIAGVKIPMDESERAAVARDLAFIKSLRPLAAGARETKTGAGAEYYGGSGALGREDLSWTFDELVGPMERAEAAGDWHAVRRLTGDFRKNHRWWFEAFGWPEDFCKVRETGRGPLAGFLCNRYELTFADTNAVGRASLPFAKSPFVVAAKDVAVKLHSHGSPGGRETIRLTGVFGGGYGDIEVTANGRPCGTIRSTTAAPRLETRALAVDFPHSSHGNDFVLTAHGERGLAILSLGYERQPLRPLDRWMAVGPFDKGGGTRDVESYRKAFPPEAAVDFTATYAGGVGGRTLAWREVDVKGRRTIDLAEWTPCDLTDENGVTYLVTYVKARRGCSTILGYSADYFGTIWVNGKAVVPEMRGPLRSYAHKEIGLKAGWNEIKVKTSCGSARRWYFAAAIADDGTFEYSPRKP